jgi:hypothetical protein
MTDSAALANADSVLFLTKRWMPAALAVQSPART